MTNIIKKQLKELIKILIEYDNDKSTIFYFCKEDENTRVHKKLITKLKAFLKKALLQQEEKLLDKAHQESCNGVSQWMNYGKRNGFWKHFEEQVKQELLAQLPKIENHYCTFNDGEQVCDCFNQCLQQITQILDD